VIARIALVVLAVGIVLELGLRFYFTQFGTDREKVMYLYSGEDIERQPALLRPLPYVNFVPSPDYPGHNRLGYRGVEIELPKPEGVFRIVALGGSTTYSTSTTWEESYPTQLQALLRDQYGYMNVEVVNAGVPGYTSWDVLANYIFRIVELEPDLVLIYDGINDIQPRAVATECYRGQNPLRGLGPTRGLWQRSEVPVQSTLYRVLAIPLGWMADPSTLEGRFGIYPMRCERDFVDDARIKDNPPVYFERNLRDLIVLAQANDIQVMLSTWTYNANGDIGAMPPAWRDAIVEHNDILRKLAAEYGLPLYDLAATDFWETPEHWAGIDPIHMAAPGTYEQARRYAAFMVEQELIPPN
jgi:lysophospholipase L1-like esterase